MKISKSCNSRSQMKFSDLNSGAVFRFGNHSEGPYLKISNDTMVDLGGNNVQNVVCFDVISDLKVLPNAELVTHEED